MANITREHKNNVFCILYSDKKRLLSLYNAVNGTDYADEEKLAVVTLEQAILLQMHNDKAFVIDSRLNLYEQQASVNPNMPLRDLYYVAEEYKKIVPTSKLYARTRVRIPAPKFITFYNGAEEQPAEVILRLSDLYEVSGEEPELELTVRQININRGYNEDILQKCESLKGYMIFVDKVRKKTEGGAGVEAAVTEAVNECVRENVLADFFTEHRREVVEMGIFEYDAQEHDRVLKEESWWEGKAEGKAEAILELLEELGSVPEQLRQTVMSQKNMEILGNWHKLAAKARTIEMFSEQILK